VEVKKKHKRENKIKTVPGNVKRKERESKAMQAGAETSSQNQ
jgi:hypothetical protein